MERSHARGVALEPPIGEQRSDGLVLPAESTVEPPRRLDPAELHVALDAIPAAHDSDALDLAQVAVGESVIGAAARVELEALGDRPAAVEELRARRGEEPRGEVLPRGGAEIVLGPVDSLGVGGPELDRAARRAYLHLGGRDHEVDVPALGGLHEALQEGRLEPAVCVHDGHVFAAGMGKRQVEGRLARAGRDVLDAHAHIALGRHVEHPGAPILGAGVNRDELDVAERLVLHALHSAAQGFLGIMDAKEDRYLW